jgi:hypothetical protein
LERALLEDLRKAGHPVQQRGLRRMEGTMEDEFVYWIGPK